MNVLIKWTTLDAVMLIFASLELDGVVMETGHVQNAQKSAALPWRWHRLASSMFSIPALWVRPSTYVKSYFPWQPGSFVLIHQSRSVSVSLLGKMSDECLFVFFCLDSYNTVRVCLTTAPPERSHTSSQQVNDSEACYYPAGWHLRLRQPDMILTRWSAEPLTQTSGIFIYSPEANKWPQSTPNCLFLLVRIWLLLHTHLLLLFLFLFWTFEGSSFFPNFI